MTGHQQEGQSQQAMQKCLACPNLIPFRGQFEDNEGQLSSNIVLHCKSCLQRLQGSGGHQTLSPRYNKPAQDQMGANRRKRQSWKSSYSVPQNSQTGRVYGTDQRGAGNVSYQLPDERQHRTNKDKLCSYYCSYCSKGFSSSAGLKVHERMHTGEKPYKCRFCPKAFTQCTNWKSHEKTHTGEKPHKCSYYEIAVVQLDDEEDEAFTAVKWRLSESTMTGHQQEGQSQQAMQKCLACPNLIPFRGQFEDNEGQLSSNIVLHCKSCLQRLQGSGGHQTLSPRYNKPAQDQMGANRRKRQSWKSSYSVPQNSQTGRVYGTDQRGAGNVSYQLPDERQHRTNKDKLCSYYCSYCSKGFSSSAGLKVHERMHTGEKPYKCRFCPKAFTQCTNWKSHEKTHTGEKPHKCSYCEKTFIRTDAMKSHERTHTGEKPYRCQNCPRAFGQRSMLKKHELLHHFDL
ncbi:putative zinc finger protein [Apostichopus japonicus]|uniref:Putative zinc finger protein n=1 Tax=Stichopus japonicus TaxID=307972 RepID=A0A2G8JBF4_STIJA|nr:putative zinc finger protein [Apostichopus japonicus]